MPWWCPWRCHHIGGEGVFFGRVACCATGNTPRFDGRPFLGVVISGDELGSRVTERDSMSFMLSLCLSPSVEMEQFEGLRERTREDGQWRVIPDVQRFRRSVYRWRRAAFLCIRFGGGRPTNLLCGMRKFRTFNYITALVCVERKYCGDLRYAASPKSR